MNTVHLGQIPSFPIDLANAARIKKAVVDGVAPAEIGVFVRSDEQLGRARAAVKAAGHTQLEPSERLEQPQGRVA